MVVSLEVNKALLLAGLQLVIMLTIQEIIGLLLVFNNGLIIQWGSGPIRYCTKGNHQVVDITLPTSFTNLYKVSLATFGWAADQVIVVNSNNVSVLQIAYINYQYADAHDVWANFIVIGY